MRLFNITIKCRSTEIACFARRKAGGFGMHPVTGTWSGMNMRFGSADQIQ